MIKTPGREAALRGLLNLIEKYETPPTRDASTDDGAAFWQAWGADLNRLADSCRKDPLMLYLLSAYTDYMIDAGRALAVHGRGLQWDGRTTDVLIRLRGNEVPKVEQYTELLDIGAKADAIRAGKASGAAVTATARGWIG